jgi:metallo-beta-lactamase class B
MLLCAGVSPGMQAPPALREDPPNTCSDCAGWNAPVEPVRLFGNTYYVGTGGLSAVLVTSDAGHVLLDGALPQSASLIEASIRALGFRLHDVTIILNSHAHFDHAGGIHALQRASGATIMTAARGVEALRRGMPTDDDPQFALGPEFQAYPAVTGPTRAVEDGEVIRLGPIAITAHLTPGHTPGSTSWSWQACDGPAGTRRCLDVVYADSLTAVSAPGFRFTGDGTSPDRVPAFRASIAKIAALPCDIVVSTHPGFTRLFEKVRERGSLAPGAPGDPMVDPQGCRTYAAESSTRLEARVAQEAAEAQAAAAGSSLTGAATTPDRGRLKAPPRM